MTNVAPGRRHLRVWASVAVLLLLAGCVSIAWVSPSGSEVTLRVDGRSRHVHTARPDVRALLADSGVKVGPADRLWPLPDSPIMPGMTVSIDRARQAVIEADGSALNLLNRATTVGALLAEAAVWLRPEDVVLLDGQPVTLDVRLAGQGRVGQQSRTIGIGDAALLPHLPTRLTVRRAVPLLVDDGSVPYTIYTTAPTVGEALLRAGVVLYLGDLVQPSLGTPTAAGLRVFVVRSKLVTVDADGRTIRTRTRGDTVGDGLVDLGIVVTGNDRVTPAFDQPIVDNLRIAVTRVRQAVVVERTVIPYESIMVPDDQLEIDLQRLAQQGQDGEHRKRVRVTYENGQEADRLALDEWVAAEPATRVTAYGRNIVSRTLDTPEGSVSYWRKVRMYATSYSPARSGTPRSAAWYGRTRIGQTLRKGIVAVDPQLIGLGNRLYISGYGPAIAGDTGGGVRGKMIDLGYEDGDYISWHQWVDVYFLDPAPSSAKIRWVLPNYPPASFPRGR